MLIKQLRNFYPTNRQTWTYGDLRISFSNPSITPFDNENEPIDVSYILNRQCYFYYTIEIYHHKRLLLSSSAHDFPVVDMLPDVIETITNMNPEHMFMNFSESDHRNKSYMKHYYQRNELFNGWGFPKEHEILLERFDRVWKHSEYEEKHFSEYKITINNHISPRRRLDSMDEEFGRAVVIKGLEKDELLRLKDTATRFCQLTVDTYNQDLLRWKEEEK